MHPTDSATAAAQPPSLARRIGLVVFAIIATVSIVAASVFSFRAAHAGSDLTSNLTLIAPAGVGGGWDAFTREQQQAMRAEGIVNNVQVVNIPGAGGTIGLGAFASMEGQTNNLLATGSAMLGGIEINDSPVNMDDTVLLARVAEDYSAIVVPADSEYEDFSDLMASIEDDPSEIVWTGGSAGSTDHLTIASMAVDRGVAASELTYIPRSGSSEAIQTILSETADAAAVGLNEVSDQIDAGRIKALGIAAPEPIEGVDVPTMRDSGYDVVLSNWRGFVGVPGLGEEDKTELLGLLERTRETPEWEDALERNMWRDSYLTGAEFEEFVREDQERTNDLLEELDL